MGTLKKRGKDNPKEAFQNALVMQSVTLSLVIIFMFWWVISKRIDAPLILPSPALVFSKMGELIRSEEFIGVIKGTLRHVLLGFAVALSAGIVSGVLSGLFRVVNLFFYPWILLLRATPVMSFILYLLLFVPTPYVAIWVSFFIVFPVIHTNVLEGFRSVDEKLLEMATLYKVPLVKQLRHIYIPSIFPYLMAACVSGMGINIKAVITAEAMALPEFSIGTALFTARNYLETETILAWTLLIILIAVLMDLLLMGLRTGLTKGRRQYVIQRRRA